MTFHKKINKINYKKIKNQLITYIYLGLKTIKIEIDNINQKYNELGLILFYICNF